MLFYVLKIVIYALKNVFNDKKIFIVFGLLLVISLSFFIYIPVKQIPWNTLKFQISIYTATDWLLLSILSVITSLSLTLNYFVIRKELKLLVNVKTVGNSGLTLVSSALSAIFGPTASCAFCAAAYFGFLGVGGIFFLLKYRRVIVLVSILIILMTIYISSKRVLGICGFPLRRKNKNKLTKRGR